MKKLLNTLIIILSICSFSIAQNDTMYFVKDGAVINQQAISNNKVDSIVFYKPLWLPKIEMMYAQSTNISTARCYAELISDGGATTSKGFCWGIFPNPTIDDDTVMCGTELGEYSSEIEILLPSYTYYVRAFAINTKGIVYSDEFTIIPIEIDLDGNEYNPLTIGTQVWMDRNLAVTKLNDGTPIPNVTDVTEWDNLSTPGYCWFNNDSATYSVNGALYNAYTIETEKLCPTGWRVPTMTEWNTLFEYLGGDSLANIKLRDTINWPDTALITANNESGFSAMHVGIRPKGYDFWITSGEYSSGSYFYTSTLGSLDGTMRYLIIYGNNLETAIYRSHSWKASGMPVRCIKN